MKRRRWITRPLALAALSAVLLPKGPASAHELVFAAGLNLSSIRTAQQTSLSAYSGLAGGVGFNFHLREQLYAETDLQVIQRRFALSSTLTSLFLPVMGKYENKYFTLGAGLYVGDILTISNDNGIDADLTGLNSFDMGWIVSGGGKLYLTQRMKAFLDLRVSRGFTNSYSNPTPADPVFYWSQFQVLVGVRILTAGSARGIPRY